MTSTTAAESVNSTTTTDNTQQPTSPTSENEETAAPEQATETAGETTVSSPKKKAPKPAVHKVDYEKDIVYLYQFSRCSSLPSASPFCLKVENWLRMIGASYENIDCKLKYKSKKGQLPFVEYNGKEIADSEIIIRELGELLNKNLDEGLSETDKNISHAFIVMLDNHTSWVVRWWRYNNPNEFIRAAQLDIKRALNSKLPASMINFFFKIGFRSNLRRAVGHGMGRHQQEEIFDFGKKDLKTLSNYLADKDYFFGSEPRLLDAAAFAHLSQFYFVPFGGIKEWMETETPNLVALINRIKEKYWPDWDEICSSLEMNTHLPKKEVDKEEEAKKEEAKKEEAKKKKEEKDKAKEEKRKENEEKKMRAKEEKEKKKKAEEERKKAEKERKEKEKAEKAEKEKAEKEKAEKEKAEKEAAEASAAEAKKEEPKAEEKTEEKTETTETKETPKEEAVNTEGGGDEKKD